jgi:hypothetical protein
MEKPATNNFWRKSYQCIIYLKEFYAPSTALSLTLLSQLPAIRKFCGIVAGLKASDETESSGGDVTSKSFIGFADDGAEAVPKEGEAPNVLWLNIMIKTYLKCNNGCVNLPHSESVIQRRLAGFTIYKKQLHKILPSIVS